MRPWLIAACALATGCGTSSARKAGLSADKPALSPMCQELKLTLPQCDAANSLMLPTELPPARGNAFGDSLAAARLGFQVFYDGRFSPVKEMRCATCHLPEKSFHDGRQVSVGKDARPLPRNSPSLFNAAWNEGSFFWDGRADTLWSQPLFAFENPAEMASTRLDIAHVISDMPLYQRLYREAFGSSPDLSDSARFPASGKPGDTAFDQMSSGDQEVVNRVAANVGKSLEAYMRKLATRRSPVDKYLAGDKQALDQGAREGLATFVKVGCTQCHGGPTLSDGQYHSMGVPALAGAADDPGRAGAFALLDANPFNARGAFFDKGVGAMRPTNASASAADKGAFRTPSLRNISLTSPYGHNGFYPTLQSLLTNHGPVRLNAQQIDSVSVFLFSLNGEYPERPWSNWPTN